MIFARYISSFHLFYTFFYLYNFCWQLSDGTIIIYYLKSVIFAWAEPIEKETNKFFWILYNQCVWCLICCKCTTHWNNPLNAIDHIINTPILLTQLDIDTLFLFVFSLNRENTNATRSAHNKTSLCLWVDLPKEN